MKNLTMIGDNVLVKFKKKKSLIVMADGVKTNSLESFNPEIIAMGQGAITSSPELKIGDKIVCLADFSSAILANEHIGETNPDDNKDQLDIYFVIKSFQILGKVE